MIYSYEAKDTSGQTVTGSLEADSESGAASQVRAMGYYPMRFAPAQGTGHRAAVAPQGQGYVQHAPVQSVSPPRRDDWFLRTFVYPVFTGVSLKDLALWYHQMGAMLNAGVSVLRTLETMEEQHPPGTLRTACRAMKNHVRAGGMLSEGMMHFRHIYNELQIEFVRSAEHTGNMGPMMERLAEYLEQDFALREMVKKETFQSKITFFASFLLPPMVILLMQGPEAYFRVAVLPLINLALICSAVYVAFRYCMQSRAFAFAVDAIKSYIPYFGHTVRLLAIAKFSRALASLYNAGVLLPAAMGISARVTGNQYLAEVIGKAVDAVNAGIPLAEAFRRTRVFPPIFVSMVNTGEESGQLGEMMDKVADFFDGEGQVRLQQSVKMLTNLIFLGMAAFVGYIVYRFWGGMASQIQSFM